MLGNSSDRRAVALGATGRGGRIPFPNHLQCTRSLADQATRYERVGRDPLRRFDSCRVFHHQRVLTHTCRRKVNSQKRVENARERDGSLPYAPDVIIQTDGELAAHFFCMLAETEVAEVPACEAGLSGCKSRQSTHRPIAEAGLAVPLHGTSTGVRIPLGRPSLFSWCNWITRDPPKVTIRVRVPTRTPCVRSSTSRASGS